MKIYIGPYTYDGENREVNVEIHPYDTWSLDCTLAEIILPALIQLKKEKHGSPLIDDEDVPHLPKQSWSSNESSQFDMFYSEEQDILFWNQFEIRWDWVMNEIIYAFDCIVNKDEPYMRFDSIEEARTEQNRITNGLKLFGKYYQGLWD